MFVGWIRKNNFQSDLDEFTKSKVIDKNLILNSMNENPSLCFGAYEDNRLVAFITAYIFEKSILINNFYYFDDVTKEIKQRVLKVLLNNIDNEDKSILFLASKDELEIFKSSDFKIFANFKKAVYSGDGVAFNFSNVTAKSISNENYIPIIKTIEKICYEDDRVEYIVKNMFKSSSLVLSTDFGYQHSYAIAQNLIKISPWTMDDGAFNDAEKLLRGVIYHRGLKQIVAFIPADIKEIRELYLSYKFSLVEDRYLIYKNKKPTINLEMTYAL